MKYKIVKRARNVASWCIMRLNGCEYFTVKHVQFRQNIRTIVPSSYPMMMNIRLYSSFYNYLYKIYEYMHI